MKRVVPRINRNYETGEGYVLDAALEGRSPLLKQEIGRAMLELEKIVTEDRVWGNETSLGERAAQIMRRHQLEEEDIVTAAVMSQCIECKLATKPGNNY